MTVENTRVPQDDPACDTKAARSHVEDSAANDLGRTRSEAESHRRHVGGTSSNAFVGV